MKRKEEKKDSARDLARLEKKLRKLVARMKERLRKLIKQADRDYYEKDAPLLDDGIYDALRVLLEQLEKEYPEHKDKSSPTKTVGSPPAGRFAPFNHPTPMRSLSNVFDEKEMLDFIQRMHKMAGTNDIVFSAEPKLDGIAINLLYKNGRLKTAATRGDGNQGENITENILTLKNIPHRLKKQAPAQMEVRGEVVMTFEDFIALNERQQADGKKIFANPRNAAGGSLRQIDAAVTATRPLQFYAHGIGENDDTIATNHEEAMKWLADCEFEIAAPRCLSSDYQELLAYHREREINRADLPFSIDGVVYKVNDFELQHKIGYVSRAPRFAIAHKFSAEITTTIINAIDMQVGRSGVLTPVARLKPAAVGGVVISNATLHNIELIKEKDIRVGDYVEIRRAGDVIPEVVQVLKEKRGPWQPPDACPSCGKSLERDGRFLRCVNRDCRQRMQALISHFVSRNAMDIDGVGGVLLEKLYEANLVKTPAGLYQLKKKKDKLLDLKLIAEVSADNILAAIEKSRSTTTLKRFLFALGISQVGENTAGQLADFFGSLDKLMKAPKAVYAFIPDIGSETADSIISFFEYEKNREQIKCLRKELPLDNSRQQSISEFFSVLNKLKFYDISKEHKDILPKDLGKHAMQQLDDAFVDLSAIQIATLTELEGVLGGNKKLAKQLRKFFANKYYRKIIEFMRSLGMVWGQADEIDNRPLSGNIDVIPEVVQVVPEKKRPLDSVVWQPPDYCPSCGKRLKKDEDERFFYCENPSCQQRMQAVISHFVSRNAMDIDGVGGALLEKLYKAGLVETPADLYQLKKNKGKLLDLKLIAEVSADNILAAIEKSRSTTTLKRFLFALGISQVEENTAGQLADFFGSLDKLMKAQKAIYAFIPDIGSETADSIISFFEDEENRKQIKRLQKELPLDNSRQQSISEFFSALNKLKLYDISKEHKDILPKGLGKHAMQQLDNAFVDLSAIQIATLTELEGVLGGNKKLAKQLRKFFANKYYRKIIEFMRSLGMVWGQADEIDNRPLSGNIFVITGTFENLSRAEVKKMIEAAGGKVTSAVSDSTDYLLAGEKAGGSKSEKADQSKKTKVLYLEQLKKMIGE